MLSYTKLLSVAVVVLAIANAQHCMHNPGDHACHDFTYDAAGDDVDTLCTANPQLIGCALRHMCHQGIVSGDYCTDFNILASICSGDEGQEAEPGCSSYNSMCSHHSVINQCSNEAGVPDIISTEATIDNILDICAVHFHHAPACSDCSSASDCPNPLMTYSDICTMMTLPECDSFYSMCDASPDGELGELCPASEGGVIRQRPFMRMFFHFGYVDWVLFEDWVPQNGAEYTGAWFAVFFFAVLSIFLKAYRAYIKKNSLNVVGKPKEEMSSPESNMEEVSKEATPSFFITRDILKQNTESMVYVFFIATIDYTLMLITMTFNVGLFFAVIGGLAVGTFFFGHHLASEYTSGTGMCCGKVSS